MLIGGRAVDSRAIANIAYGLACAWLLACTVYGAVFVWLYPMHEEASVLHYLAWMIDTQQAVPYRDVFETAFPGSLLFHLAIGQLAGYGDVAFRLADIAWLATLAIVTYALLRPLGKGLALVVALSFTSYYFKAGAGMTLQRDAVLILPIATALLVAQQAHWPRAMAALLCGLLFGLAASSKPHALIGLPAVFWLLCRTANPALPVGKGLMLVGLAGIAGLFVGFGMPLFWLWQRGGLPAFVDMLMHYMPLYADMGGFVDTRQPWPERLVSYLGVTLAFAQAKWFLLLPAAWFAYRHTLQDESRHAPLVVALFLLALLYFIYVFVAGKFYNYHWMPFRYFALLASSLLLLPPRTFPTTVTRWHYFARVLLFSAMIADFACTAPQGMRDNLRTWQQHGYQKQEFRGDYLATLIREHAAAGDRIQVLDTGGSAIRALLLTDTVLASPISSYGDLFHSTSEPAIQRLRQGFLQALQANPPVLVIDNFNSIPAGCEDEPGCRFDAFYDWLDAHYRVLQESCHDGGCKWRLYGRQLP